ncbi:helix-turn-helix domain-containing protein [Spirosoma validum]|uniref:Helix-turn-helix transcriptional regulator n=1 Tax=Spirosoma validum TaxID=2771355 RepID=A0A927GFZ0_9BACT|nr:helix-turn-helix transcriptional regulator [Spirosoma validum]MBD2756158.1 helix-turn-helix transcriptional regulator [Spirosoma validum]
MNKVLNQSTRIFDIVHLAFSDSAPTCVQPIRFSSIADATSSRFATEIDETEYKVFVPDTFLHQLVTVLDQRLSQIDFTVEKLASDLAVCPRTLHRKTTSLTTLPPTKLIRLYRLNKAVDLLQKGYSVSDTANAVGFENLSYFTKCFTKEFKKCPSDYTVKKL